MWRKKTTFLFILLVLAGLLPTALAAGWQPATGDEAVADESPSASLPNGVIGHLPGGSAQALALSGSHVWVAFGTQLAGVDVSDPADPREVSRLELGHPIHQVTLYGNYAFLATTESALQIIDISDPARPQRAGLYTLPVDWGGKRIEIRGNYLYVMHRMGFDILDLTTVPTLQRIGNYAFVIDNVIDLDLEGPYAFLLAGWPQNQLTVLNISDPRNPFPVASRYNTLNRIAISQSRLIGAGAGCSSVCYSFVYLYAIDYQQWTFSHLGTSTEVDSSWISSVMVYRSRAWVGKDVGLRVYDFRQDSYYPALLQRYPIGNVKDVVPTDDYIYAVSAEIYWDPSEQVGLFILEPPPGPPLSRLWLPLVVRE